MKKPLLPKGTCVLKLSLITVTLRPRLQNYTLNISYQAGTINILSIIYPQVCFMVDKVAKNFVGGIFTSLEEVKEHVLAVLDDFSFEELGTKIKEYGITAPDTKNPLSDLNWSLRIKRSFSLMFQTSIGPFGLSLGYMRPETAQGIFVNFKDLYYYNGSKLPFAATQIG